MEIEDLQKIGLNVNEAKIYLALLELGEALAGEISKKTQINRTTVYDSIERLIQQGLVTFVISANRKVFKPVPPKRLLDQTIEKQNSIKEILPELEQIYHESKEKEETILYKGKKGIKSILNTILKSKEYVAFGSSGNFLKIMQHDFILFQKRKKELKIKSRVIMSETTKNTEIINISHTEFRYIPDEFSAPTTTFVYTNNTAIIVWGHVPIATVITSKEVAVSYKHYFEMLWKIAKK